MRFARRNITALFDGEDTHTAATMQERDLFLLTACTLSSQNEGAYPISRNGSPGSYWQVGFDGRVMPTDDGTRVEFYDHTKSVLFMLEQLYGDTCAGENLAHLRGALDGRTPTQNGYGFQLNPPWIEGGCR